MNFQKYLALFLALMMSLALVACGANQDMSATTDVATTVTSNEHLAFFEESIASFMDHIVTEVPRESWDEVMSEMPWSYRSINTFNTNDPSLHGDDTWVYYDGQFCVMADSWHFLEWSSNIKWDVAPDTYDQNRTFSLEDNTKDGYMLFLLGDYYFYLVEISSTRETQVTCLEDNTLDGFYALWGMMECEVQPFMKEWRESPVIDQKTLDILYNYEQIYVALGEYAELISEPDAREEAVSNIELGYCHDPIETFLYDREYRDFTFAILDGGMCDMQYTYNYKNGTYSLGDNYFVTVDWTMNIRTESAADDFYSYRHYEVIDPTEDAYILQHGDETGYTLVRIVAQGDNSVHTSDTSPSYTFEEFNHRLYANIEDNCDKILEELAKTGELTEDCLQYLRINAEDHEELYWYGEHLTGADYEHYIRLKNGGWIDPPLAEIDITGTSEGHLYTYSDGVFSSWAFVEVISTSNIADVQWDPYDRDTRHFFIENHSQPAYIEVMGEGGHQLYYFYPG